MQARSTNKAQWPKGEHAKNIILVPAQNYKKIIYVCHWVLCTAVRFHSIFCIFLCKNNKIRAHKYASYHLVLAFLVCTTNQSPSQELCKYTGYCNIYMWDCSWNFLKLQNSLFYSFQSKESTFARGHKIYVPIKLAYIDTKKQAGWLSTGVSWALQFLEQL